MLNGQQRRQYRTEGNDGQFQNEDRVGPARERRDAEHQQNEHREGTGPHTERKLSHEASTARANETPTSTLG